MRRNNVYCMPVPIMFILPYKPYFCKSKTIFYKKIDFSEKICYYILCNFVREFSFYEKGSKLWQKDVHDAEISLWTMSVSAQDAVKMSPISLRKAHRHSPCPPQAPITHSEETRVIPPPQIIPTPQITPMHTHSPCRTQAMR